MKEKEAKPNWIRFADCRTTEVESGGRGGREGRGGGGWAVEGGPSRGDTLFAVLSFFSPFFFSLFLLPPLSISFPPSLPSGLSFTFSFSLFLFSSSLYFFLFPIDTMPARVPQYRSALFSCRASFSTLLIIILAMMVTVAGRRLYGSVDSMLACRFFPDGLDSPPPRPFA